jgi:hypothetical protein
MTDDATKTPEKSPRPPNQRGLMPPWPKGVSGNPKGRPEGSRNKATLAIEALLDSEGESLTRKCIEMAQGGDQTAMRLCLDRIVSPRKDRPVKFALPPIDTAADAAKASAAIIAGVAAGDLTRGEAGELCKILETHTRLLEANNFEERIKQLENKSNGTAAI